jgi:hypothetical protein
MRSANDGTRAGLPGTDAHVPIQPVARYVFAGVAGQAVA